MRNRFEQELQELNRELIEMGQCNEKSLQKIIELFDYKSGEEMELIKNEIREYEMRVDALEHSIQSKAMRLLVSQQPVARDLRLISTAMNIITDMERISDQAYDIAEISVFFQNKELIRRPDDIIRMVSCCIGMVNDSVDAFIKQDLALARQVIGADDEVDSLFLQVRDELIDLINQNRESGEQAIDFMIIAKYLERIADHAVNIAEWVIFNCTGEHKNQMLL